MLQILRQSQSEDMKRVLLDLTKLRLRFCERLKASLDSDHFLLQTIMCYDGKMLGLVNTNIVRVNSDVDENEEKIEN